MGGGQFPLCCVGPKSNIKSVAGFQVENFPALSLPVEDHPSTIISLRLLHAYPDLERLRAPDAYVGSTHHCSGNPNSDVALRLQLWLPPLHYESAV